MNGYPNPADFQRWNPDNWSEIVGNSEMVETWKNFIQNGPCNALFTGPSRSGKTRVISLGIRSLLCPNRTVSLDPCGKCDACKMLEDGNTVHAGVFSALTGSEYDFYPIDCEKVTGAELDDLYKEVCIEKENTIIYLDEVAALKRRRLEGTLLKWVDESKAIWIASAISLKRKKGKQKGEWKEKMSKEMRGRFSIKVGTSNPHPDDLEDWIKERSEVWGITIIDPESTIPEMVARTRCRVGYVMNIFTWASTKTNRTIDPVEFEKFNFDVTD